MSLRSLHTEIVDRQIENGARFIDSDYTFLAAPDHRLSPEGLRLAEAAASFGTTRLGLIQLRRYVHAMIKESDRRLAAEMAVVFKLSEARDRVLSVRRMTKGEAAATTNTLCAGDLLDLDAYYDGLLVRGIYVFVSDTAFERGVRMYGADALNGLIRDCIAA